MDSLSGENILIEIIELFKGNLGENDNEISEESKNKLNQNLHVSK